MVLQRAIEQSEVRLGDVEKRGLALQFLKNVGAGLSQQLDVKIEAPLLFAHALRFCEHDRRLTLPEVVQKLRITPEVTDLRKQLERVRELASVEDPLRHDRVKLDRALNDFEKVVKAYHKFAGFKLPNVQVGFKEPKKSLVEITGKALKEGLQAGATVLGCGHLPAIQVALAVLLGRMIVDNVVPDSIGLGSVSLPSWWYTLGARKPYQLFAWNLLEHQATYLSARESFEHYREVRSST